MSNGHRKLTARDVLKIYRSRWTANASEVAQRYNISRSMVYKIYRRAVWPSVLEQLDQPEEPSLMELTDHELDSSTELIDGTTL